MRYVVNRQAGLTATVIAKYFDKDVMQYVALKIFCWSQPSVILSQISASYLDICLIYSHFCIFQGHLTVVAILNQVIF